MSQTRKLFAGVAALTMASAGAFTTAGVAWADPAPPIPIDILQAPGLPAMQQLSPVLQQAAANPQNAASMLMAAARRSRETRLPPPIPGRSRRRSISSCRQPAGRAPGARSAPLASRVKLPQQLQPGMPGNLNAVVIRSGAEAIRFAQPAGPLAVGGDPEHYTFPRPVWYPGPKRICRPGSIPPMSSGRHPGKRSHRRPVPRPTPHRSGAGTRHGCACRGGAVAEVPVAAPAPETSAPAPPDAAPADAGRRPSARTPRRHRSSCTRQSETAAWPTAAT